MKEVPCDLQSCCFAKFGPTALASGLPGELYSKAVGMEDLMMYWFLRRDLVSRLCMHSGRGLEDTDRLGTYNTVQPLFAYNHLWQFDSQKSGFDSLRLMSGCRALRNHCQ